MSETHHLRAIDFVSPDTGWVVGIRGGTLNGIILKSSDGGTTWTRDDNGLRTAPKFLDVFFVDKNHGWAVGENDFIRKTTDGGSTWTDHSSLNETSNDLFAVLFVDTTTGWVVGERAHMAKSSNGGLSWVRQRMPLSDAALFDVHFFDGNNGWVVGQAGLIFKTINGGADWIRQPRISGNDLFSISFVDSEMAWAVGEKGTIIRMVTDIETSVEETRLPPEVVPRNFTLKQNYPNPFNSSTIIQFTLPRQNHVTLIVYDLLGRIVETLVDGERTAGEYKVQWSVELLPSGIYFYRLQVGEFTETRKMVFQR